MTTHGFDLNSNADSALFQSLLPRWIADHGPAVVLIDHVVKDKEKQDRFALGAQHKLAGIDGVAYIVKMLQPFARGKRGLARVEISKDRPGHVREYAHGRIIAEFTLDATASDVVLTAHLMPPGEESGRNGDTFEPTSSWRRSAAPSSSPPACRRRPSRTSSTARPPPSASPSSSSSPAATSAPRPVPAAPSSTSTRRPTTPTRTPPTRTPTSVRQPLRRPPEPGDSMTNNRPRPNLVPTSSLAGDDLPKVTSSLVPHPIGDEVTLRPSTPPTTTTPPARPRDEVKPPHHPHPLPSPPTRLLDPLQLRLEVRHLHHPHRRAPRVR